MAICWWTIFASWLCLLRYGDSDIDKHPANAYSIVSPTSSHALLLSIIATPKQCFSQFLVLVTRGWMATAKPSVSRWIQLAESDNEEESLSKWFYCRGFGNISYRAFVYQVFKFFVSLLHHLPCFDRLVVKECILYLSAQPVTLGVL
jgi:hypothetical protein